MKRFLFSLMCLFAIDDAAFGFPMRLEWDAPSNVAQVPGPVKYRLYRRNKTPANSQWFKITETYNTYYTAQILTFGSFVYRVTAFNSQGESAPSNELPVRVELCAKEET